MIVSNTRVGEDKPDIAFRNLCRVIDGQHRVAGLEGFTGENFDVLVSIFVGSDIADQAHVFATVNLEQTKVGKSLAIDLFDLAKTRSPIKTAHNISIALDNTEGPAYNYLALPGQYVESKQFSELFKRVDVKSDYFTIDRFKPGTSGESSLRKYLMLEMFDIED